ncbi:MAG: tetratricopeptide repeat protein [Methylobacter sp.]|nr:tetratricopeptide repeat protein [Methylobacter sp.]
MNGHLAKHNNTIDINAATRGLLLRMGNTWFEQDELWQAVDVYLKIIEEYPDSEESEAAQSSLMSISRGYEQDGLLRLSLDVLERIEQTMTATV